MADTTTERACPYCKEAIKAFAVICPYCLSGITPAAPNHGGVCPFCGESINEEAIKCRFCKSNLLTMSVRSELIARADQTTASALPTPDLLNCYQYCFLRYLGDDAGMTACMFGCDHHA